MPVPVGSGIQVGSLSGSAYKLNFTGKLTFHWQCQCFNKLKDAKLGYSATSSSTIMLLHYPTLLKDCSQKAQPLALLQLEAPGRLHMVAQPRPL